MFNRHEFKHLLTAFAELGFLSLLGRVSVLSEINFASTSGHTIIV